MRGALIILSFAFLTGCLESGLDFTPADDGTDLNYEVSSTFAGPNDAFEIIGISPSSKILNLYLSYSGGCQRHSFKVIWDGEVKEVGDFKEVFLKVFHQGNNDECDAIVKPVVSVELSQVLGEFVPDITTKIIVQNGSNGRTISIDPTLSRIAQTTECVLDATFENSLCGFGVWQNNWFRMKDSLGTDNSIWLQPVSHNRSISSDIPDIGDYNVGVTLLFGYQSPVDASCLTIPSGRVVPVEINCISLDE